MAEDSICAFLHQRPLPLAPPAFNVPTESDMTSVGCAPPPRGGSCSGSQQADGNQVTWRQDNGTVRIGLERGDEAKMCS
jgi:hypothetical protein